MTISMGIMGESMANNLLKAVMWGEDGVARGIQALAEATTRPRRPVWTPGRCLRPSKAA